MGEFQEKSARTQMNRYEVEFSRASLQDLDEIFDYVAQDSIENALKLIDRIEKAANQLDTFPSRARIRQSTQEGTDGVWKIVVRPYLIFYSVSEELKKVQILRIRHGARRYPRRFQ